MDVRPLQTYTHILLTILAVVFVLFVAGAFVIGFVIGGLWQ